MMIPTFVSINHCMRALPNASGQGFYTNLIVWVNIQEKHPRTNILPPTGTAGMSNGEIQDRIYGTMITFIIEQSMVVLQFLCKLCMCFMYLKLT